MTLSYQSTCVPSKCGPLLGPAPSWHLVSGPRFPLPNILETRSLHLEFCNKHKCVFGKENRKQHVTIILNSRTDMG